LHGSIGDVTRALPLATMLRKGFPRSYIAWSVEPTSQPLLEHNPAIDQIILFDRGRGWRAIAPFLRQIREKRFDLVLDLQRILKSGLISCATGAPRRIGFNRADAKELNWVFNNLHIEPFDETIPKIEHYFKFTDYLGLPREAPQWDFRLTANERAAVQKHICLIKGSFAVLFVGTRWQSKRWFPTQIARCADLLHDQYSLDVVFMGGESDRELADESMKESKTAVTNLVAHTSLREAIGIIERAKLAIGPDTGLMHIAAAVGTPVISLWGATRPQRTGPYGYSDLVIQGRAPCVPCNRKRCPIGRICMQSITTAEINERIAVALRRDEAKIGNVDAV
ncbi:MAG TPA: lipopolysaccharide heptosyltransferase II, partial [Candidatus Binatia bacterium]